MMMTHSASYQLSVGEAPYDGLPAMPFIWHQTAVALVSQGKPSSHRRSRSRSRSRSRDRQQNGHADRQHGRRANPSLEQLLSGPRGGRSAGQQRSSNAEVAALLQQQVNKCAGRPAARALKSSAACYVSKRCTSGVIAETCAVRGCGHLPRACARAFWSVSHALYGFSTAHFVAIRAPCHAVTANCTCTGRWTLFGITVALLQMLQCLSSCVLGSGVDLGLGSGLGHGEFDGRVWPQAEELEAAEGFWCYKSAAGEEEGPLTVSQLRGLHSRWPSCIGDESQSAQDVGLAHHT